MDIPEELIAALEFPALELTALQGVNGVGIGLREENEEFFDELAVRVYVDDAADAPELPSQIIGLPLCLVEFPIEPLFAPDVRRYDELMGGAQIEQASERRHSRRGGPAQRRQLAGRPDLPSRSR
ncbi:hypothetical protein [Streptomyces sp. NPDC055793]